MKERRKKLYGSKKELAGLVLIAAVTLIVTAVICCIFFFGLETACSREISNAYKSTVSRLSDEINRIGGLTSIGGILKESSAESSEGSGAEQSQDSGIKTA